jgi:hypothetical protein
LGEYRRVAAQATSAYLAERDLANSGGHVNPEPKAEASSDRDRAPRPQARRGLIGLGAALALAVIGLTAASLGGSDFNDGARPGPPRTVVGPSGDASPAFLSVAPTSSATTGRAALTPPPATSASGAAASDTAVAAVGSASGTALASGTSSASGTGTPVASASPGLLDLCRSVVAAGNSWPSVLKGADRATVIAAAGKKNNVLAYCTALVASTPTP